MNQGAVHDTLAGTDRGRRDRRFRAVAAFADCFNGRKILLIIVAIAQEKQVFQPRSAFQAQRVFAEKFSRHADETNTAAEQRRRQVGFNTLAIFALVKGD